MPWLTVISETELLRILMDKKQTKKHTYEQVQIRSHLEYHRY